MSLNASVYAPSDVLNAPALRYVGWGQPLTPYFVAVPNGTSFTIPKSAISWSITANSGSNATINGVVFTGAFTTSGNGTLFIPIVVSTTAGTVNVTYTLNNVVYNTPSYY